jgi:LysR family glycine cleavage system transcriptional activator
MGDRVRLPPLNTLRGFEAAARYGSFAKAADELALTPSAVSHQVRQLESALGQRLFQRLPRELVLTDAGRDFLATVRESLELLSVGVARLAPYKSSGTLIVACDAAFARFWLVPRLAEFRRQRPEIDLWLDTSERLTDFDRQEVEFVIGRLRSTGADRIEELLFDDHLGPGRAAGGTRGILQRPDELAEEPLIHDERRENWLVWLRAVGARAVDAARGAHYSDPGLAIDAALAGQGIALVSDVLAAADIVAGRIETPFRDWLRVPGEYRFAFPRWLAEDNAVAAFAAFVRTEAIRHRDQLEALRSGARVLPPSAGDPGA